MIVAGQHCEICAAMDTCEVAEHADNDEEEYLHVGEDMAEALCGDCGYP